VSPSTNPRCISWEVQKGIKKEWGGAHVGMRFVFLRLILPMLVHGHLLVHCTDTSTSSPYGPATLGLRPCNSYA
jgi:hypothetical protein